MRQLLTAMTLGILLASCTGCQDKEIPVDPQTIAKGEEFKALIPTGLWRLDKYFTEVDVDYMPGDDIPPQRDHWPYVSGWLHDDKVEFRTDGTIIIHQGNLKYPNEPGETVQRSWQVIPTHEGVKFHFLTFEYRPYDTYYVNSMTDSTFRIQAIWQGQTVFSIFKKVQ